VARPARPYWTGPRRLRPSAAVEESEMGNFTEAYEKGIGLLKSKCFDSRWAGIEARIKTLMAAGGPNDAAADVLNDIRQELENAGNGADDSGVAIAAEMMDLCRDADRGFQDRAAFLEMLRHFYLIKLSGNHRVWVQDGALKFHKWVYDEFDGQTRDELKRKLAHEPFLAFGSSDRQMFAEALQQVRKWSMDIVSKLGKPDQNTLKIVRRWFHDGTPSGATLNATAVTLLDGFKRIAAFSNSTSVVFSDNPPNRDKQWDASANSGDKMPVIYVYGGFLKNARKDASGRYPRMWFAALTLIHELSHNLISTKDLRYDLDGLKPGTSFSAADAINNADSWAYFAADMVGAIPAANFNLVYS
jgi:hypothetical protein